MTRRTSLKRCDAFLLLALVQVVSGFMAVPSMKSPFMGFIGTATTTTTTKLSETAAEEDHDKILASEIQEQLQEDHGGTTAPNPDLDAVQVATLCMDALKTAKPNESLEVCFNFSTDRCQAAVGGSLDEFIQHASNPIFGALVACDDYEIASIGPIIPGGKHRGEMQTVLIDIKRGIKVNEAINKAVEAKKRRSRPSLQEILRKRGLAKDGGYDVAQEEYVDDGSRRFLWTLQKERRPPRQDCWLVHEVLFVKNAHMQTT